MSLADPTTGEIDCNLSSDEVEVLASAEDTIQRGLTSFLDVGDALAQIRDDRLYRSEHRTFEEYCNSRWGFAASRARQLIAAAELATDLQSVTDVTLTNEAQARALARVPEADRGEVAERAAAAGPLSAPSIEATAAALAAERSGEGTDTPPSVPAPEAEQEEVPPPPPAPTPPAPRLPKSPHTIAVNTVIQADSAIEKFLAIDIDAFQSFDEAEWEVVQFLVRRSSEVAGRIAEAGRRRRRFTSIPGGKP